jgi:putative DNA primase/helicase
MALSRLEPAVELFFKEYVGYCLTTETLHELALWFYGKRGGGKSTLIGGVQSMLGVKAGLLGLADIERNRFALAAIPGKTLVVSTEQPSDYFSSTYILNALISGEPITVDRKFKEAMTVKPYCKLLWAMNEWPRVGDANDGIFRRVKVIELPAIPEKEQQPEMKDAIANESAGILNWAIEGLQQLRARGKFDVPPEVQEATKKFVEQNDIPASFVAECCECDSAYSEGSNDLYSAYHLWASNTGHKPKSATSIANDWERLGFTRYRANGRTRWKGVRIKP